jgi:hypothetical protein
MPQHWLAERAAENQGRHGDGGGGGRTGPHQVLLTRVAALHTAVTRLYTAIHDKPACVPSTIAGRVNIDVTPIARELTHTLDGIADVLLLCGFDDIAAQALTRAKYAPSTEDPPVDASTPASEEDAVRDAGADIAEEDAVKCVNCQRMLTHGSYRVMGVSVDAGAKQDVTLVCNSCLHVQVKKLSPGETLP